MMNKKAEVVTNDAMNPIAQAEPIAQPLATNPMQAAIQSGASPSELLQFMELQERWEANEARKAFNVSMSKFRADCPTIEKTEKAHNSKHASIAGILRQIKALLNENGLSHSWVTSQDERGITVTCKVTHIQGHSESTSLTAPADTTGSKNAIQAIGSTITYLERYTLAAILGLATGDADDDGNAAGQPVERINEDQALTIHSMIEENELDMDAFLRMLKSSLNADGIDDIAAQAYPHVISKIEATIKAKQK